MTSISKPLKITNSERALYDLDYYGKTRGKHEFLVFRGDSEWEVSLTDDEVLAVYAIKERQGDHVVIEGGQADLYDPSKGHIENHFSDAIVSIEELVFSNTRKILELWCK